MNKSEYLLTKLAEECSEIIQAVSKIQTFGLKDVWPGRGVSNQENLIMEMNDFIAVVEMLNEVGIIPNGWIRSVLVDVKIKKVKHWMRYSRKVGRLGGPEKRKHGHRTTQKKNRTRG